MRKVLVLLAVAAFAMPGFADLLWDNGMDYSGVGSSQDDTAYGLVSEMADDFVLEAPNTIVQDVEWLGGYWGTGYNTAHFDWRIRIYEDAGDIPGNNIFDQVYPNAQTNETFVEDNGASIWYHHAIVMADLPLVGGDKYWVSAQGVGDIWPQAGFGLHQDAIIMHEAFFRSDYFGYPNWTTSSTVFGYSADNCFQITGIPEPASLALLALGGLALLRRR